jgi:hypothetical protein
LVKDHEVKEAIGDDLLFMFYIVAGVSTLLLLTVIIGNFKILYFFVSPLLTSLKNLRRYYSFPSQAKFATEHGSLPGGPTAFAHPVDLLPVRQTDCHQSELHFALVHLRHQRGSVLRHVNLVESGRSPTLSGKKQHNNTLDRDYWYQKCITVLIFQGRRGKLWPNRIDNRLVRYGWLGPVWFHSRQDP